MALLNYTNSKGRNSFNMHATMLGNLNKQNILVGNQTLLFSDNIHSSPITGLNKLLIETI